MKLIIDGMEVEIRAKQNSDTDNKDKRETTLWLLNQISLAFQTSADYHDRLGCNAIAKDMRQKGSDIYEYLDSKGLYHF